MRGNTRIKKCRQTSGTARNTTIQRHQEDKQSIITEKHSKDTRKTNKAFTEKQSKDSSETNKASSQRNNPKTPARQTKHHQRETIKRHQGDK